MKSEKDNKENKKTHLHDGHRERMRERFLASEDHQNSSFQTHELLEMLLFFSVPRSNTNETAHRLLAEFGSLRGLMDAPNNALLQIDGVGKSSAMLIRIVSALIRAYNCETETYRSSVPFSGVDVTMEYLRPMFFGHRSERMYMILLNNIGYRLDTVQLAVGTSSQAVIDRKRCIQQALNAGAANVILAHNHPGGSPLPSQEDLDFTDAMERAFSAVGICLLEHYIVTETAYYAIIGERNLKRYGRGGEQETN